MTSCQCQHATWYLFHVTAAMTEIQHAKLHIDELMITQSHGSFVYCKLQINYLEVQVMINHGFESNLLLLLMILGCN